ncbi:ribonuclease H-like domain-containing protein [Tanacetum coccineum]
MVRYTAYEDCQNFCVATHRIICHKKYDLKLLDRAPMATCYPTQTPIDTKSKLGSDEDLVFLILPYIVVLPVVCSKVCLHMHDPREPHFSALKSSVEAEYIGVANVVAETALLRNLLPSADQTFFDIDIHFVRDMVARGEVRVLHASSRYHYVNIFTMVYRLAI